MTREELCSKRDEALGAFGLSEKALSCTPYGNGHINDTFLVVCKCGKRYILQRINHQIFKKPQEIMENICAVTS
ncbi:MAG: mucin desulfatase, partial [Clostridia bacterium]|nr:mucin desulfatase [Clostridia bacterium]